MDSLQGMKNIGKPCTGKPYARFDEGGLVTLSMEWLLRHRRTKGAETDRPFLPMRKPALYSTRIRDHRHRSRVCRVPGPRTGRGPGRGRAGSCRTVARAVCRRSVRLQQFERAGTRQRGRDRRGGLAAQPGGVTNPRSQPRACNSPGRLNRLTHYPRSGSSLEG